MSKNIVLVGFMGVGKGRVARLLAAKTSFFAVDCDDLIESYTKIKVRKIFARYGEPYFRALELQTAHWLEKNVESTIISTGGGFFKVPNIKEIGTVVYLHAEFDTIVSRMLNRPNSKKIIKKRPLLGDLDRARRLYDERLSQYRDIADIEISLEDETLDQATDRIIKELKLSTHQTVDNVQ